MAITTADQPLVRGDLGIKVPRLVGGKIPLEFLPEGGFTPEPVEPPPVQEVGGFNPGTFGFVAPEQFTSVTGVSARINAAIAWAHDRGLSVHANMTYPLDAVVQMKNKHVRLWGSGTMKVSSKDLIEAGAISGIHDRVSQAPAKLIRQVILGASGSDKPGVPNTNVLTEIVPTDQAELQKWESEHMLRLDSKSTADSYGFWTSVVPDKSDGSPGSARCWAASTAAVMGVGFSVMDATSALSEGATVTQSSSGASGMLKMYSAGPVRSGSPAVVVANGKIVFEKLSGTFTAGEIKVDGVVAGRIILDPKSGELGSIIVKDNFHDPFTTDLVISRLPNYITEINGISFDVNTGPMGDPEGNILNEYRPTMALFGNVNRLRIRNVVFRNSWATCVLIAGCPDYNIDMQINQGVNDARGAIGAYGYGLEVCGPSDRGFADLVGRYLRHVYTTNPYYSTTHPLNVTVNVSAYAIAAAGTTRYNRTTMKASFCWANAWDTHEGAYGQILEDFFIHCTYAGASKDSGNSGASTRSWCNTIRRGTVIGAITAFTIAGQSVPGCPTDDINYIEDVKGLNWQFYGINLGSSMPEPGRKHFTYIRRVDLKDAGFAGNAPYNSIGIYGQAISFATSDVNIERFNYAPVLVRGPKPAGVEVDIRITRTMAKYTEAVTNYANPMRFESATGMHIWAYQNEVKAKSAIDTATTKYTFDFSPSSFIYTTGSPIMHWLKDDILISTGDDWSVPMYASGGTDSAPKHMYIPVSSPPVPN